MFLQLSSSLPQNQRESRRYLMLQSSRYLVFLLSYTLWIYSKPTLSGSIVSIVSAQQYLAQLQCVQFCLWHPGATDDLAPYLGCTSPWLNDCYCRNDLASSASVFLTSCVNQGCSKAPNDVSLAVSVYNGYCTSNAPAANAPAANTATPTVDGAAPTATLIVVTTVISSSDAVRTGTSLASSEFLWDRILTGTALCLVFFHQLLS